MADLITGSYLYAGNFICIPLADSEAPSIDVSPFDPPDPVPGAIFPGATTYPSSTTYPGNGGGF